MADVRISLPMLVQNQKKLLCPTQSKYWQKAFATSLHYLMHDFRELFLSLVSLFMNLYSISALDNQDINFAIWKLSWLKMSVLFPTVVTSV